MFRQAGQQLTSIAIKRLPKNIMIMWQTMAKQHYITLIHGWEIPMEVDMFNGL
jgi:hypothetical protein